jgi:hypothetical protein
MNPHAHIRSLPPDPARGLPSGRGADASLGAARQEAS